MRAYPAGSLDEYTRMTIIDVYMRWAAWGPVLKHMAPGRLGLPSLPLPPHPNAIKYVRHRVLTAQASKLRRDDTRIKSSCACLLFPCENENVGECNTHVGRRVLLARAQ